MSLRPPLEPKVPGEIKDYGVDWSKHLESDTTITDSSWSVPSGLTEDDSSVDGQAAVIRLSGGVAGQDYTLENTIETSTGETLIAAIEVRVRTAAVAAGI